MQKLKIEKASLATQKTRVRKLLLARLSQTSQTWFETANRLLLSNLQSIISKRKIKSPCAVLGWIPHFFGEANLLSLSETELPHFFCPCCLDSGGLEFFQMPTELQKGRMGILEPNSKTACSLQYSNYNQIICLVPGLAFDQTGARLGRGKGMYDSFLSHLPTELLLTKVGICWSFQIFDSVPTEEHDQKMDLLCTEQGLIEVFK